MGGLPSMLTNESKGNMKTLNVKTHAIAGVGVNYICSCSH